MKQSLTSSTSPPDQFLSCPKYPDIPLRYVEGPNDTRTLLAGPPSLLRRSSFGDEGRELCYKHGGPFDHIQNMLFQQPVRVLFKLPKYFT
jgi:hypothetical protein